MKKIITIFSITFIILQSCSSGDSDNNTNTNTTSVSDVDGNVYQTVTICNQTWTKSNLNVSRYRNGDVIPQVTNGSQWATLTTGAWCYYANTTSNGTTYGKLYNWYAVNDPRGLAPLGYHIPTDAEWTQLVDCLGGSTVAGGKMKSTGTIQAGNGLWQSPNTMATNESGFTGLPGGWCDISGTFTSISNDGRWWSSSEYNPADTWGRDLSHGTTTVSSYYFNKSYGYSVRCIKN